MDSKHAYLVIAHNDFGILEKLIRLIDDSRNDIYLHIDKKIQDFDYKYFQKLVSKSKIYFIERLDIRWGDFSLVQCEVNLLKAAVAQEYQYYHLLSGVDLPLKSNDEIHEFYNKHQGKEFVHFATPKEVKKFESRVYYYYFMRIPSSVQRYINFVLRQLQKAVKYKRSWDMSMEIQFGAQWFSITNELAKYVISMEDWINRYFCYTCCADEMFLQTIVYNSAFRKNLYYQEQDGNYAACMRYIDWTRGKPYVFREEDFELLINSDKLFARKFSTSVDEKIITKIYEYISAKRKCIDE